MIRSLRTGVLGLRSHQSRMDVVGNNIANVNTAGFKRSRVVFHEMLGQHLLGTGRSLNSSTIGSGVTVGSIDQAWQQGSFEYTSLATDLALGGDGFFLARGQQGNVLTRSGNFQFDAAGRLVTAAGLAVQGWAYNPDGSLNTGDLQDVQVDFDATAPPRETSEVTLGGNLSASLTPGAPDSEATTSTVIYDAQGQPHTLVLTFAMTGVDTWTLSAAELAGDPGATPPVPATPLTGTGATLDFDVDGTLVSPATIDLSGVFPNSDGDDLAVTLDVGTLTQFGGSTTTAVSGQDGQAAGRLIGYEIDTTGSVMLSFSNGELRPFAQLALGSVNNPNGLEQLGDNYYGLTASSGDLVIGRAGQEIDTSVVSGALEMSNVDLATEFTDMIVTQRGYQASARVISTSDELLQEVVQLKR